MTGFDHRSPLPASTRRLVFEPAEQSGRRATEGPRSRLQEGTPCSLARLQGRVQLARRGPLEDRAAHLPPLPVLRLDGRDELEQLSTVALRPAPLPHHHLLVHAVALGRRRRLARLPSAAPPRRFRLLLLLLLLLPHLTLRRQVQQRLELRRLWQALAEARLLPERCLLYTSPSPRD